MRIIQIIVCLLLLSASAEMHSQTKKVVRQKQTLVVAKPANKTPSGRKIWYSLNSVHEGLICAENANYKYGFLDKTGKTVIPFKWDYAADFHQGFAMVKDQDGKYGFIDKTGKQVIPCTWKFVYDFYEGVAMVKDENNKFGFIDQMGKVVPVI